MLWEFYSVISVKELPNRNCFRINSVIILCVLESVKCRFSKCRFSAELKNLKKISEMGGSVEKTNAKSLGPAFSLCRRAGIDAALAKADFFFAGAPTIENKIEQKIQNTKVASAKVAFDTV